MTVAMGPSTPLMPRQEDLTEEEAWRWVLKAKVAVYCHTCITLRQSEKLISTHFRRQNFTMILERELLTKWQGRVLAAGYLMASLAFMYGFFNFGLQNPCSVKVFRVSEYKFRGSGDYIVTGIKADLGYWPGDNMTFGSELFLNDNDTVHLTGLEFLNCDEVRAKTDTPCHDNDIGARFDRINGKEEHGLLHLFGRHFLTVLTPLQPEEPAIFDGKQMPVECDRTVLDKSQVGIYFLVPSALLALFGARYFMMAGGPLGRGLISLVRLHTSSLHSTKIGALGFVTVEGVYLIMLLALAKSLLAIFLEIGERLNSAKSQYNHPNVSLAVQMAHWTSTIEGCEVILRSTAVLGAIVTGLGLALQQMGGFLFGGSAKLRAACLAELAEITGPSGFLARLYQDDAARTDMYITEDECSKLVRSESMCAAVNEDEFPFDVDGRFTLVEGPAETRVPFTKLPLFLESLFIPVSDITVCFRVTAGVNSTSGVVWRCACYTFFAIWAIMLHFVGSDGLCLGSLLCLGMICIGCYYNKFTIGRGAGMIATVQRTQGELFKFDLCQVPTSVRNVSLHAFQEA